MDLIVTPNQYDNIMRGEDPSGTGNYSGGQVSPFFSSDMEAATGALNGFDDVRATENGGSASITFVSDGSSQVAQFNLFAGGLNDVWLRENFGDFLGQEARKDNLWLTFKWLISDFDAINLNQTNKVCTIQWSDGVSSTRTHQIIINAYNVGGGFVFRIEHLWFTNGTYAGSTWLGNYTTDYITENEWCYVKVHVVNSTSGASDGSVTVHFNDTLVASANNVSINSANNEAPGSVIFGTYNSAQGSTANGYTRYDDVNFYESDPGSWGPASMPTWRGLSGATITSSDAIFDLRTSVSANAPSIIRNTNGGSVSHIAGGGYYGQGTNRFYPNNSVTNQYLGIGSISGFESAGDSTRVTIGALLRWGQGFVDTWMTQSYKYIVMWRNPDTNVYERPMAIVKGGTTEALCPGNNTVCNCTDDPWNNWLLYNDTAYAEPDINNLGGVHCWVEFKVDCNGPDGLIEIKTWSEDSVYQGQRLRQLMTNGQGVESYGAVVSHIDTISYLEQASAPGTAPADTWYELEYMRLITGSVDDISPPPGFPGHNPANW